MLEITDVVVMPLRGDTVQLNEQERAKFISFVLTLSTQVNYVTH